MILLLCPTFFLSHPKTPRRVGEDYSGTLTVRGDAATVAAKGQARFATKPVNQERTEICSRFFLKHCEVSFLQTLPRHRRPPPRGGGSCLLLLLKASRNVIINDLHRAASSMILGQFANCWGGVSI